MRFMYSDGGRSRYFATSNVGDCVTRAIANATGLDYKMIYKALTKLAKRSVRDGCPSSAYRKLLSQIGLPWVATMTIGSGCVMHMDESEIPSGDLIVRLSRHLTCIKDRVMYDTYDCSRDGERCVYGYWIVPKGFSKDKAERVLERIIKGKTR